MRDLKLLLEKVRTAEAGSRELDLNLHARVAQRGEWAEGDILYALTDVEGTTAPPHYTTSLDAIVALIERNKLLWSCHNEPKVRLMAAVWPDDQLWQDGDFEEDAATPALALCAAFLAANIQTGSGETGK